MRKVHMTFYIEGDEAEAESSLKLSSISTALLVLSMTASKSTK